MTNDGKFFVSVIIGAVLVIGAVILFAGRGDDTKIGDVVAKDAYKLGADSAPVKIIAFEDFQCPACKSAEPAVRQMLKDYADKVQYEFVHFPLPIHANAEEAALASEAAGKQGKFWEMKNLLYDNQEGWANESNPDNYFGQLAKQLGLDMNKFIDAYKSDELRDKIKTHVAAAEKAGINQTPTFVVNGKLIAGAQSIDGWRKIIDEAIAASSTPAPQ